MSMTPLPMLDRTSATFKDDVDDFFSTDLPQFVTEANALETAVDADATAAANSASAASTSANNAATSASNAASSASAAASSASAAAASASSALNAPGTSATSSTSLTIGTGSKAFTIQIGKEFAIGQFVVAASAADVSNYMIGQITAHNNGTGALTVNVSKTNGSGTHADWTISLTADNVLTIASQAEMETGTETELRSMSPLRIAQAIAALSDVKQVVTNYNGSQYSLTTSDTTTNHTVTITPSSTSSKILILCYGVMYNDASAKFYGHLCNGTTGIHEATAEQIIGAINTSSNHYITFALMAIDSPASISAQTYNLRGRYVTAQARINGGLMIAIEVL